ncbi:MAG: hypothetical protein LBD41_07545, partial [Clostridiales Family XIII bacterium]|nr:hypothetical protein [Clostridiales Family XIII bacterium]
MNKKTIKNIIGILFIFIIAFVLFTFPYSLIRGEKKISEIEQRNLTQRPKFSLKTFINGEYQKNLESSFADQFAGSGTLKQAYLSLENDLFDIVSDPYYNTKRTKGEVGVYKPLSNSQYIFESSDGRKIITEKPNLGKINITARYKKKLDKQIKKLNEIVPNSVRKYFYFEENRTT